MTVGPSREPRREHSAGNNPVRRKGPLLVIIAALSLAGHAPALAAGGKQSLEGVVASGDRPISFATVKVYEARQGRSARLLGRTATTVSGIFSLDYKAPRQDDPVVYVIADGGRSGRRAGPNSFRLATVLGNAPDRQRAVINERTTVATAYAMAQFIKGKGIGGLFPGLQNAAATVRNLVDIETGEVGTVLGSPPNGGETSTLATFNSLANMLAACVRDTETCGDLFRAATPPSGRPPRDTFTAMVDVALNPGKSEANVGALLELAQIEPLYQPALGADAISEGKINSWVLAVRYIGDLPDGQGIDGPGNVAFDSLGNAWVNNNYEFNPESGNGVVVCGGTQVVKLTPTGGNAPDAPFGGTDGSGENAGGLYGAGFGITLDPEENVWISSFGFQGDNCPNNLEDLFVSVAKFAPDGTTLSTPDGDPANNQPGGFGSQNPDQANMQAPQSIVSDREGNIWTGNCHNNTITRFRLGDPEAAENFTDAGVEKPFGLAIAREGHLWVAGNENSVVVELDRQGRPVGEPIAADQGITKPMGIASDSNGNLWVANAGLPNPPCPPQLPFDDPSDLIGVDGAGNRTASVTLIEPEGGRGASREVTTFARTDFLRTGLRWPWGVAVDGDDNVWVANFAGQRLMPLCGLKMQNCLPGTLTGDALALQDGYYSDALERVTAVQIDPSGNVWAANNWKLDGFVRRANPGGYHMVVFIGLAAPIKTPLIGPPEQPVKAD